jgi:hypothetical protein
VLAVLVATLSLVLIPLLVMSAVRLAGYVQFRAARGPGVPDLVPEAWLRQTEPPTAA